MRRPRLALLAVSSGLALVFASSLLGGELLHAPMPSGASSSSCACDAPVCLPPCPSCPPKVVVELSQPEVHFTGPCRSAPPCEKEQAHPPRAKMCSFLNVNISKVKGSLAGAQPVTSIVPAYATATIPIAFQTTRFAAVGTELGVFGAGRREVGELGSSEIKEIVSEAIQREIARQRESARQREAAPQTDVCAELKTRIERVEQRLGQIEKQVDGIVLKLKQLP